MNFRYVILSLLLTLGAIASNAQKQPQEVVEFADKMPKFPGDEGAFYQYLRDNIKYPQQALDSGTQGTIYISVVIDTNGNVAGTQVLKGGKHGLTEEALRVLKKMPRWEPGETRGKKVNIKITIPIKFVLTEPEPRRNKED